MCQATSTRTHVRTRLCAFLGAGALAGAFGLESAAAQAVPTARAIAPAASIEAYWTPERMQSAIPMDMPKADPSRTPAAAPASNGAATSRPGSAPTVDVGRGAERRLFVPNADKRTAAEVGPADFGTAGYYHTTSRLFPNGAVRTYPNSAAGKLFFSDTVHGGNFVCSAAAITYRLIVTAGHCVAHGSTSAATRHFYSNILFVPAYNSGAAPFKQWPWVNATTTNNWFLSGSVPNAQDTAIVQVADVKFAGVFRRLGTVTGWLGWWTLGGRQLNNHITQLGYPCNLDSCEREQINSAGGVGIVSNNLEIGSLMGGGSSGGPWIQDYGVAPAGASTYTAGNWVLATTSYQYLGTPSPQRLGASIFQNAGYAGHGFGDLWNTACGWSPTNCNP